MKPVLLYETIWPCWAYVLQRKGRQELLTFDWLYDVMPKLLQPYKQSQEAGNILVWKAREPIAGRCAPVEIDERGNVVWRRVEYAYHAALCEPGGFATDMSVGDDEGWAIPFNIRKRRICDLHTPDFLITDL